MMNPEKYIHLKDRIVQAGYGCDIEWSLNIKTCDNADDFFLEYGWTVMCSGMKEQVVRPVWEKIIDALVNGGAAHDVFRHKGKAASIDWMWLKRQHCFKIWSEARDKLAYLKSLSWIGDITKWHFAKNLGMDVCKPDRHLTRIATMFGMTPKELCLRLSEQIGDPVRTVDTVLWRAANLGFI